MMLKISCMLKQVDSMIVFPSPVYPFVFPRVPGECFFLISFGSIYLSKCFIRSVRYLRNFFSDLIGISDYLTIPFHSLTTSFSELALSSFAYSKRNWLFPWPLGHIVTLWLLSPPYLVAVIVYWTPCLFCFVTSFCWRSKCEWKSDFLSPFVSLHGLKWL